MKMTTIDVDVSLVLSQQAYAEIILMVEAQVESLLQEFICFSKRFSSELSIGLV